MHPGPSAHSPPSVRTTGGQPASASRTVRAGLRLNIAARCEKRAQNRPHPDPVPVRHAHQVRRLRPATHRRVAHVVHELGGRRVVLRLISARAEQRLVS